MARLQIPAAEDDLWEQVVFALLRQRDVSEQESRDHLRLLEELAFHSRFCGRRLTAGFAEDTATWLAEEKKFGSPRDKAQEWLADLECWELLIRHGSANDATYEFPIPGLDEYFAARHLAARWAEGDERYRKWLPCTEGWWKRGEELHCPNFHCRAPLPSFHYLLDQAEYEETFLLTVGLLKSADREKVLLSGITDRSMPPFLLKALARSRFAQPAMSLEISAGLVSMPIFLRFRLGSYDDALVTLRRSRVTANLRLILYYLLRASRYGAARIKFDAAELLVRLQDTRVIEPLIAALKDRNANIRRSAARILGETDDVRGIKALAPLLWDKKPSVRVATAQALGKLSHPRAIRPLVAALNDKNWEVRWEACRALGMVGKLRAIHALRKLLDDPSREVRRLAEQAIFRIQSRCGTTIDPLEDVGRAIEWTRLIIKHIDRRYLKREG